MIAGPASAEPLCRDLKGLFTPCPKELNKEAASQLEARTVRQGVGRKRLKAALAANAKTASAHASSAPSRPLFAAGVTVADPGKRNRPKLCRDLKGLYTPCAK